MTDSGQSVTIAERFKVSDKPRAVAPSAGLISSSVIPLEQMNPNCGCAAKVGGRQVQQMLASAFASNPGAGGSRAPDPEDCAVLAPFIRRSVFTVDLGPLVSSDPYRSGVIAAAHGSSDIFAMGADPSAVLVMLLVDGTLPQSVPADVLKGIIAQCSSDGAAVVGGHTIIAQEAMAGVAVIGQAGARILTKRGASRKQTLMVSKPLGVGLAVRAHRLGFIDDDDFEPALATMEISNREASRAAVRADVSAATDVTGFGLLGHLAEMLAPEGLGATIHLGSVPILDAARDLPDSLAYSMWIDNNLGYSRDLISMTGVHARERIAPLLDPQTSGGLLVAVDGERVDQLRATGFHAIGTVTDTSELEVIS
jgi:selenide,water dikinase